MTPEDVNTKITFCGRSVVAIGTCLFDRVREAYVFGQVVCNYTFKKNETVKAYIVLIIQISDIFSVVAVGTEIWLFESILQVQRYSNNRTAGPTNVYFKLSAIDFILLCPIPSL